MKKTSKTWIAAGLLTIVATVTTIYCLLEYRSSVLIVGISALFLLASAFWLFLCLSKLEKPTPTSSVGEEQRERMNYEGMKLQGEELIRLVNTLGKGTYVYSKRSSEHLEDVLNTLIQNQQANEELIHTLMQEQTKAAKFQVRYNQDDTSKIVSALTSNVSQINENLEKCIQAIASQPAETNNVANDSIATSLTDLSKELAHINTSIQALQLQLSASAQPIMYAPVSSQPAPISEAAVVSSQEPIPETVTAASQESAPEAVTATSQESAPEAPTDDTFITDDVINDLLMSQFAAEEPVAGEPIVEAPAVEEPVAEEPIAEAPAVEETVSEESATDISSIISDDPNKQLSADEIAALFAALG